MNSNIFILDSNFFIEAHRRNYPFDIFPIFWKNIAEMAKKKKIISIDKVRNEIYWGNSEKEQDILTLWCKNNLPDSFFAKSEESIFEYNKVIKWAVSKSNFYKTSAINEFLENEVADAWLISYAIKHNCCIVTHEVSSTSKKKIKIPDVCNDFDIEHINTIELLRQLNLTF